MPNLKPYYQVKLTLCRCMSYFLSNLPKTEDEKFAYDIIQKAYWINEKKIEMLDFEKRRILLEDYHKYLYKRKGEPMKKTLLNKRWIFFIIMFSILVLLGLFTLEEEIGISIAVISLGLVLILGYALIIPNSYTFSQEGITVRYCFGLKTFLCWKDLKHIEDHYSGGKCFPWWRSYEIAYFQTKIPFHERAYIPKNKKTTEMIRKYYHKTIDKYG